MRRIVATLLMMVPMGALGACATTGAPAVSIDAAPTSTPPTSTPPTSAPPPPSARPEASVTPQGPPQAPPRRPSASPEDRVAVHEGSATGLAETAQVVATMRPAFRRCFAAALKREPNTSGKLVLHVKIDPAGKVTGVKLDDELGLDVELAGCLVSSVRAGTFPPAPSGATLTIPINVAAP